MPEADRILLHAVARVVIVSERGSFEDQTRTSSGRRTVAARRLFHGFHRKPILNLQLRLQSSRSSTVWVVSPRRPRIRDASRGRTMDTCAVVQRHRQQPGLWISGYRNRQRLYVVTQQPRESPDAVVQRCGQRSARRSDLSSRRRFRNSLVADAVADSRARAVHHQARSGLQRLRTHEPRHIAGAACLCAARCAVKISLLRLRNRTDQKATTVSHSLQRTSARRFESIVRALHHHRDR